MYNSGTTLRTSADFYNAIFFQLTIEVFQDEPIDAGGIIESHTEYSVKSNGAKFIKPLCAFKVR